jgi:hypothetical protein
VKISQRFDDLNIPEWALPYLINGDPSGLEPVDVLTVSRWLRTFDEIAERLDGTVYVETDGGAFSFFSSSPAFGLPTTCENGAVLILSDSDEDGGRV